MARKPILVVMAAGMGSRYGGLKQIDPVGSQGEAILDYSLYDAHKAGFDTAVIIIKEAIRKDFMETVGERLKKMPHGDPLRLSGAGRYPRRLHRPGGTHQAMGHLPRGSVRP